MFIVIEFCHILIFFTGMQFLEKENSRLELEMKDILNELDSQKSQNELMRGKIEQLEMSLKHSQVFLPQ